MADKAGLFKYITRIVAFGCSECYFTDMIKVRSQIDG